MAVRCHGDVALELTMPKRGRYTLWTVLQGRGSRAQRLRDSRGCSGKRDCSEVLLSRKGGFGVGVCSSAKCFRWPFVHREWRTSPPNKSFPWQEVGISIYKLERQL